MHLYKTTNYIRLILLLYCILFQSNSTGMTLYRWGPDDSSSPTTRVDILLGTVAGYITQGHHDMDRYVGCEGPYQETQTTPECSPSLSYVCRRRQSSGPHPGADPLGASELSRLCISAYVCIEYDSYNIINLYTTYIPCNCDHVNGLKLIPLCVHERMRVNDVHHVFVAYFMVLKEVTGQYRETDGGTIVTLLLMNVCVCVKFQEIPCGMRHNQRGPNDDALPVSRGGDLLGLLSVPEMNQPDVHGARYDGTRLWTLNTPRLNVIELDPDKRRQSFAPQWESQHRIPYELSRWYINIYVVAHGSVDRGDGLLVTHMCDRNVSMIISATTLSMSEILCYIMHSHRVCQICDLECLHIMFSLCIPVLLLIVYTDLQDLVLYNACVQMTMICAYTVCIIIYYDKECLSTYFCFYRDNGMSYANGLEVDTRRPYSLMQLTPTGDDVNKHSAIATSQVYELIEQARTEGDPRCCAVHSLNICTPVCRECEYVGTSDIVLESPEYEGNLIVCDNAHRYSYLQTTFMTLYFDGSCEVYRTCPCTLSIVSGTTVHNIYIKHEREYKSK